MDTTATKNDVDILGGAANSNDSDDDAHANLNINK